MIIILSWFIAVPLFFGSPNAQAIPELTEPKVVTKSKTITLGPQAQLALRLWKSNFQVYPVERYSEVVRSLFEPLNNQLPMAVEGDFNGDTKADIALMGKTKDREYIVVLLSSPAAGKYNVSVLRDTSLGNSAKPATTYLSRLDSEVILDFNDPNQSARTKEIEISTRDALQIEVFLSNLTEAYYYDGRKFRELRGRLK